MKNTHLLPLLFAAFLATTACEKEPCERDQTATLTISNSSSNPYKIYVDGAFEMELSGNSISRNIQLREGNNRTIYAEQVSGFLFFPTERTTELNIVRCSEYTWQIP